MRQPNRVKIAMREGRVALGYYLTFPSPHIVEILAPLGFDFVWIDGEHGPFTLTDVEEFCRTAEMAGITPIARVSDIGSSTILQDLDRGIQGIMGPHINSKAAAEQLVKACYFGPIGERSFGGTRGCDYDYELTDKVAFYKTCNDNMLVGALLEDDGVLENLDEILSVPGIDYFSVGPNDFAQGLGFPGEPGRPEVVEALDQVHSRIRAAGCRVGSDVLQGNRVKELLIDAAPRFLDEHRGS